MESWQMHDLLLILGKLAIVYSLALYYGYITGFIPQQALWAQGTNINFYLRKRIRGKPQSHFRRCYVN